jgi:hypothetical protein
VKRFYDWPPNDKDAAETWSDDHEMDAIAYAASWTHSGHGYCPEQARAEWPHCPGFDFDDGLPDWDTDMCEEAGYRYRTVLCIATPTERTADGWERVASFRVNPEPELYDEDGELTGHMYIGEDAREAVYRLSVCDEHECECEDEDDED